MRIALLLVLLAAGCTGTQSPLEREGKVVAPANFRPGSGVIQSIAVLRGARPATHPPRDPSGGLVSSEPDPNLYRLFLHMDVGGFQSVDVDNGTFAAGDAIELTQDGRVLRVSGTALQDFLRR